MTGSLGGISGIRYVSIEASAMSELRKGDDAAAARHARGVPLYPLAPLHWSFEYTRVQLARSLPPVLRANCIIFRPKLCAGGQQVARASKVSRGRPPGFLSRPSFYADARD